VEPVTNREAGDPLTVGQVEVQAIKRTFDVPEMARQSNVTFGTVLRLLGYDLHKADDQLTLKLHWQALRRMEESFTFFVHLVNTETGDLVVQADAIPHDWTYLTTWWEAGEVVSDRVVLPLSGVPPAGHRLQVGVCDGDSGERLRISDGDEPGSDRYIVTKAMYVR
jgi:hypothetical protein